MEKKIDIVVGGISILGKEAAHGFIMCLRAFIKQHIRKYSDKLFEVVDLETFE